MSGRALVVALRDGGLFLAFKKPVAWCSRYLAGRGEHRPRRGGAGSLSMRAHLLRDLGVVEADACRLGLLE